MTVKVAITDAELKAIHWLSHRPSSYEFTELQIRKRLVERFLERVQKAAVPRGTISDLRPVS